MGIAGKVMSVPYADRTGISDQTREMLGNVAYGCPAFSEMIPFSSKFQEKDTTYAWAKDCCDPQRRLGACLAEHG